MYKRKHHQLIYQSLLNFNSDFLRQQHILFGGGTRIALELDEFRKSVDLDFLCQNKQSYRSVREQITSTSLGSLVLQDFDYSREIMFDRDSVRTLINVDNVDLKLEFVCFDNYQLVIDPKKDRFPVPCLDHVSCFYTKLLANADRAGQLPFKDIFDILMMSAKWQGIPDKAFILAREHYGRDVDRKLMFALQYFLGNVQKHREVSKSMGISTNTFSEILEPMARKLCAKLAVQK